MANNSYVELNPQDIDLLEKCLRRELGAVTGRAKNDRQPKHKDAHSELELIHSLLGKLKSQKAYFGGIGTEAAA